jgi:hypothetical protein
MRYAELATISGGPSFWAARTQKNIPAIYQERKIRLYFNKHPKNLKHSAPQKKTCLPEKE